MLNVSTVYKFQSPLNRGLGSDFSTEHGYAYLENLVSIPS